jgi:hypothetical protein
MKKIIIFLTVLLVVSCAARKVNKSQVEVKQQTTSTTKDTVSQTNEKSETEIDMSFMYKKTFIPMNESLPFTVDGKVYQNVKIEVEKTKKDVTTTKKENSVLNQSKTTQNNTTTEIKEDTKDITKDPTFNWLWLLLLIIPIIIYLDYKRN